jgi:restriction system protein
MASPANSILIESSPYMRACPVPELSAEEQAEALESTPAVRKWWNMVQWVRQHLVELGELDGSTRGVWKITDAGRARLKREGHRPGKPGQQERDINIRDLANANRDEVKRRLLTDLKNLSPVQFEHFCSALLQQLGFQSLTVTKRSADGGIDGHGDFRQGAVSLKSAFQAKRWTDNAVGRPEIDRFRGAIQGEFDHGVFITTSRFARQAVEASYRKGAITILLLDGEAVVELMVERGIGVTRQPVYLHEIDPAFFSLTKADKRSSVSRCPLCDFADAPCASNAKFSI